MVLELIYTTQTQQWDKFKQAYGADAKEPFFKLVSAEIDKRGTLHVLRKGVRDAGCKFELAYFRPSSGLNEELQRLYDANNFSVVRQLTYSERTGHILDLTIFLNGLPLFTAEVKNPLTGQTVADAMRQYRQDRDPHESLFAFGRCLAHFAVDAELVYMTTHLQEPKTRFLPFNIGWNGRSGNPPSWNGYSTSYLWEDTWAPDSVLNLLQHFIYEVHVLDDKGNKTGQRDLLFPRYHQLDSVRRLIADARERGPGQKYLVQHSAGTGKSYSIGWLAHQLASLHDDNDERVFDSIVVVTDRRVLDWQLQNTMRQLEQTRGIVENIDKTSRQLKQALEDGKNIIVTTLQKFPVIVDEIESLSGSRFAVIVDEAHSSQSGESAKSMSSVLSTGSLEDPEMTDAEEEMDLEDRIVAEMQRRQHQPHVSMFAFTATPKTRTLELFGTRDEEGRYRPFSLYTMRQAIEEHFIMDVLENYTTYKEYWRLLKTIKDDLRYDRNKANAMLKSFVSLHEHVIDDKIEIVVGHFAEKVQHQIGGGAKAMIVTRSRLHAVRYKLALDQYLKDHGHAFKALVAFSGIVHDGGRDYTEANMNGFPESQTAEMFKQREHRFLIVAEKFQTGFDQPLLHTMYVDRTLTGLHAVQALSRLNRVLSPEKQETMVLDFANEAEEIRKAFEPYYNRMLLTEGTDPHLLYEYDTQLAGFHFYDDVEVNGFAQLFFDPKATQAALHAVLAPVIGRWKDAAEEEQKDLRSLLEKYVRLYAFLSQIIPFNDPHLEKLYHFGRLLLCKMPIPGEPLPRELVDEVDMESYRIQQTHAGKVSLERGITEVEPQQEHAAPVQQGQEAALSEIIEELNKRFGTDLTEKDKVFLDQLEKQLATDLAVLNSLRVNTTANARLTFNNVLVDMMQTMIDANFKFYKLFTDQEDFAKFVGDSLFDRILATVKSTTQTD